MITRTTRWPAAGLAVLITLVLFGAVEASQQRKPSGGPGYVHRAGRLLAGTRAPRAVTHPVGYSALEPTIGIDEQGRIFYAAAAFDVAGALASPDVLRSLDGGRTWEDVSPKAAMVNSHPVTLDPYVYLDRASGRVFNIDLTVACSYLSFSDDLGDTWTSNPLACGRPVNDHQTLFSGPPVTSTPNGYDNVVYYCFNDVASSTCSKSLDGGITFAPTGAPAFVGLEPGSDDPGFFGVNGLCGGLHGHGAVGPDGTVYLPREYCGRPLLAISRDEGASWAQIQVSDIPSPSQPTEGAPHPSVAVDDAGNVYYLWIGQRDRLPYLAVSRDGGQTFGKPIAAGPPVLEEANLPQIDAAGRGHIAFSYYGSTDSPYSRCKKNDGGCSANDYRTTTWNGYITVSADALAPQPTFYSATINPPADPLVRGMCGPGRCQMVFDFIDVVIGPDGYAYAPFVDSCTGTCVDNLGRAGSDGLLAKLVGAPRLR